MGGLTRKLGPLPVWAWALIVLVLGYVFYKRFSSSSSPATAQTSSAKQPQADPGSALGLTPSAGSPSDTGQSTSDLVTALGGQQASLLAALETQTQDVLSLAQSQIYAAQTQTSLGSFQTETQAQVAAIPGTGNAPAISYVSPSVVNTPTVPAGSSAKVTSPPAALHYYTYKTSVPLRPGQSVHFTSGRGYYAA